MGANAVKLGNRLKELRARQGFTQATLAEALEVSVEKTFYLIKT